MHHVVFPGRAISGLAASSASVRRSRPKAAVAATLLVGALAMLTSTVVAAPVYRFSVVEQRFTPISPVVACPPGRNDVCASGTGRTTSTGGYAANFHAFAQTQPGGEVFPQSPVIDNQAGIQFSVRLELIGPRGRAAQVVARAHHGGELQVGGSSNEVTATASSRFEVDLAAEAFAANVIRSMDSLTEFSGNRLMTKPVDVPGHTDAFLMEVGDIVLLSGMLDVSSRVELDFGVSTRRTGRAVADFSDTFTFDVEVLNNLDDGTPVPEPGSLSLLSLALAAAALSRVCGRAARSA